MSRSYAIIGTGALGGYYGARLYHAGNDVHFLLHSDYEHVRQHGLVCESKDGNFSIAKPNTYSDVKQMPRCDVVCVCLKTTQNHLLPELLPPVLKENGVVLMMQNGLGIEEPVAGIVGASRVLGCLCFICTYKTGPGHIRHLDYGNILLAEFAAHGVTERLRTIGADFEHAGISVQLADDLQVARWHKLVWNIPYNGLTTILHADTAALMADPQTRQLVEQIMWEVVADARACGAEISADFVAKMLKSTDSTSAYRTSMQIDFEEHRPLEVETMFGNPLRAAQAAGAKSPLIEMLYRQLHFLNSAKV